MQEDRDFSYWLDFFEREKPDLAEFVVALDTKDTYFLNHEMPLDYDDELYDRVYPAGFIEGDFNKFSMAQNDEDRAYYATRVSLYLWKGLSLKTLKERLGEDRVTEMVGECLIDGLYEELNVEFHHVVGAMFKSKVVKIDSMIDWGFMHGTKLGERYGEIYTSNPVLLAAQKKSKELIEKYQREGLIEPKNNRSAGNVGNDWEEDIE